MSLSQEARAPAQGGFLNHRVEFAREEYPGHLGADPDFRLYSDNMTTAFGWTPEGNVEGKRGLGNPDIEQHFPGAEENEVEMSYHLQRWFVDGSGDPLDAAGDGLLRDEDSLLPNTHTVVDRETQHAGGPTGAGFRTYAVGRGGKVDTVETEGDAGESLPLELSLTYQFESVRMYSIYQPDAPTMLAVASTDAADTGATVTIEDEGAATFEDVALNGTTLQSTTASYADIDSVELSEPIQGDLVVSVNTGTDVAPTAGTELTRIRGATSHNGIQGDLGIPSLGAGSRESEIQPEGARTYELFHGTNLQWDTDEGEIGPRLNTSGFTVENNVEGTEDASSRIMILDEGERGVEVETSIAGPRASYRMAQKHLMTTGADLTWDFDSGDLIFPMATITDPGEYGPSTDDAVSYIDVTFESRGINVTTGA